MTAAAVEAAVGQGAEYVHCQLEAQARKMLNDPKIGRIVASYVHGSWSFSDILESRSDEVMADVLLVVAREHHFAVSHGFRQLIGDDATIPARDLYASKTAVRVISSQDPEQLGLLLANSIPVELRKQLQASPYNSWLHAAGVNCST